MLKALLVDDERAGLENLQLSIETYCEEISETVSAANGRDAELLLLSNSFDLLFLDIHMPKVTGFDLLQKMKGSGKLPPVILVSAHPDYGLEAFKAEVVIDYITKPIDAIDLKRAVKRAAEHIALKSKTETIPVFTANADILDQRINLPHHAGFDLTPLSEIVRIQADGAYTNVFKNNGHRLTVSRTLKEFEKILPEQYFVRVHHSHLINLHYLDGFNSENGGTAVMQNNDKVLISRRKLPNFQQKVKEYSLFLK